MPVNNEVRSLVNTKSEEKFLTFETPFNYLPFNVLETWRRCKLMIKIETVKFFF